MEEQVKQLQDEIKALKEQQKSFEEAKTQLKDSSQFIEDASILVAAIMKDEDLKTRVQNSIAGNPNPPATPPPPPTDDKKDWKFDPVTGKPINESLTPPKDQRVDSIDGTMRMKIIDEVEKKFKYSNLKDEDKKDLRKRVGSWLSTYNMKVVDIPVDQLEEKLSDAYLHVGLKDATKEGKTDEIVNSYFEDPGKFPSMGSGNPDNAQTQLSPTQKKWTSKLQISEDKVAANLKELTETGTITYKPKEENKSNNVPSPSGTPTPPSGSN